MWALARLRSGRPLKATDVAAEFEVNVRTAYRDLDFLRDEWRVPLEFDRAKGSYLLTEPMTALPPVTLSQGELVSLYFAEKVLAQYRDTPFERDLASAFRKMQELLPQEVRISPGDARRLPVVRPRPAPHARRRGLPDRAGRPPAEAPAARALPQPEQRPHHRAPHPPLPPLQPPRRLVRRRLGRGAQGRADLRAPPHPPRDAHDRLVRASPPTSTSAGTWRTPSGCRRAARP